MLPLTARLLNHPRVQADPRLRDIIETFADMDRFEALNHHEIALRVGYICAALYGAFKELDDGHTKH